MKLMVKRDGSTVAFDSTKITRAIALAFRDAKKAAIGVNCEAPSFATFVSWLGQANPHASLGEKNLVSPGFWQTRSMGIKSQPRDR